MASSEHLQKLTVAALKAELAERGLDITGKKQDLVVRLQEAFQRESTNEGHERAEVDTEDAKEETNVADANGEEQHGEARALADIDREDSFTHEDEELNYNEEDEDYEGVTELETDNFAGDPDESEHVEGNGAEEAEHEADEKAAEDGEGEGNPDVILLDSHSEVEGGGTVADVSEVAVTSTSSDVNTANNNKTDAKKSPSKKTEKPASTTVRVFIPPPKEYRLEKMIAQRSHMVVLYPISYEDSIKPIVAEQIAKSVNYSLRFSRPSTSGTLFGHCILEFGTTEEASKVTQALAGFSELTKVYQMTVHDQHIGDVRRKLDDNKFMDDYNSSDTAEERTVYACKLPRTVTEEQLVELFPDASCVYLPRNREETKGRAYLEFGSREAAKNIVKSETPLKIGDDVIVTRMLTSDVSIEAKHAARKKRYEHLMEKKKAAETGNKDKIGEKKELGTSRRGGGNRSNNRGVKRPASGVDLRSQLSKRPFVSNESRRGGGNFNRPSRPLAGRLSMGGRSGPSPLMSSSSTPRSSSFRNAQSSRSAGPMRMQRSFDSYSDRDRHGRMSEGSSVSSRLSSSRFGLMSGERSSSWGVDRLMNAGGETRGSLFSSNLRSAEPRYGGFDGDFRGSSQRDYFDDQMMRGGVRSLTGAAPLMRSPQLDDGPAYGRGPMEQRMGPQGGRMGGQFENRREIAVDEAIRAVQRQQVGVDDSLLIPPSRDDLMGLKRQVVVRDLPQGQGQGSLLGGPWHGSQSAGPQYRAAAPQMRQSTEPAWAQPNAMNRSMPASNTGYSNVGGYDSYGQGQGQGQGYMAGRRRY